MSSSNSFNITSFNIGGGPEDYELLLSSFYPSLNEFQTIKWKSYGGGSNLEGLSEAETKRNAIYLNLVALGEIVKIHPIHKHEWENLLGRLKEQERAILTENPNTPLEFLETLREQAIDQFLQEPSIAQTLEDFHLDLLSNAGKANPQVQQAVDKATTGKNLNQQREIKINLAKNPNYQREMVSYFMSSLRDNVEKKLFTNLPLSEVIFLQEVENERRFFISQLKTKNYAVAHFENEEGRGFNSAVALNEDRFNEISNYSISLSTEVGEKDCAICVATDKQTGKRFAFVSAHIPGFKYQLTGDSLKKAARNGNVFCKNLLLQLDTIEAKEKANKTPIDATIIGSDVNASPEKLSWRFKLFKKKGFSLKRTGSPTNVHFMDQEDKLHEIDYFFSRVNKSFRKKIKQVFTGGDEIKVTAKSFGGFGFDMSANPSDHKPISGEVTVVPKSSLTTHLRESVKLFRKFKKIPTESTSDSPILAKLGGNKGKIQFKIGFISEIYVNYAKLSSKEWKSLKAELSKLGNRVGYLLQEAQGNIKDLQEIDLHLSLLRHFVVTLRDQNIKELEAQAKQIIEEIMRTHGSELKKIDARSFMYTPEQMRLVPSHAPSVMLDKETTNAYLYLQKLSNML